MINHKKYSDEKEQFRLLANQMKKYQQEGKSCIAFTSHTKDQGKSYIISQIAATLAKAGNKVLVIDANIFEPTLTEVAVYTEKGGFENILCQLSEAQSDDSWERQIEQDYILYNSKNEVYFMAKGNETGESHEKMMQGDSLKKLMSFLKPKYDYILIEAPSFEKLSYVQFLSEAIDGCIVVLKSGSLKIAESAAMKEKLGTLGCKALTCILNNKEKTSYKVSQNKKHKKSKRSAAAASVGEQVTIS